MVAAFLQLHDDVHETRYGALDAFTKSFVVTSEYQSVIFPLLPRHLYSQDPLNLGAGRGEWGADITREAGGTCLERERGGGGRRRRSMWVMAAHRDRRTRWGPRTINGCGGAQGGGASVTLIVARIRRTFAGSDFSTSFLTRRSRKGSSSR